MRIALALFSLSACSFALVSSPPPGPPAGTFDCTSSYALPIVDGVAAAAFGAATIIAFATPENPNKCNPNDTNQDFCLSGNFGPLVGALLIVPTVLYAIAAYHGFSAVSDCRDARALQPPPRPKPWNPDER
jgi:hypothetical protein